MPAKINLLNQRFGKLVVLEELAERRNNSVVWLCQCDCGNKLTLTTKELRNDGLISCHDCGTKRNPLKQRATLIGKKFNHLTVLEATDRRSGGCIVYKCECDCPEHTITYVSSSELVSGGTKSCGCIARKYQSGDIINNRKILSALGTINKRHYYKCECLFCHRVYNIMTDNLDHSFSCGCQRSIGEYNIIQILEENHILYKKEFSFPNSLLRYDFALLNNEHKIIRLIEFDGEQHYLKNVKNNGWNTMDKYLYTEEKDIEKNNLAHIYEVPLIRIPYWERNNITLNTLLSDEYIIK